MCFQCCISAIWSPLAKFWESILLSEKKLSSSNVLDQSWRVRRCFTVDTYQMRRWYRPKWRFMAPTHGQRHPWTLNGPDAVRSTCTTSTQCRRRRWCQPGERYIAQQHELAQRIESKYSCIFDGLNWVSLPAVLVIGCDKARHGASCTLHIPLVSCFLFHSSSTTSKHTDSRG